MRVIKLRKIISGGKMRELINSEINKLSITDVRSGTDIELHYRNPDPSEEVSYQTKLVRRKGTKIITRGYQTRLEFGLKILTGFREGDFSVQGKPISADPKSPNYREDWREIVKNGASDLIRLLAMTVFEGARLKQEDIVIDTEEVIEDAGPLDKK